MSLQYLAPAELTSTYCGQLLNTIDPLLSQGDTRIDFSGVTQVDSSAVALLLEWTRHARKAQRTLDFIALPSTLKQLISVYGVQDLLQIKP